MKISLKNYDYIKSNNNICIFHVLGCTRGHKFHKPINRSSNLSYNFFYHTVKFQ